MKLASSYGIINNGELTGSKELFKKVVDKNGGQGTLNKALQKANNPLVKMGLKKLGIDEATLNNAVQEIKGVTGSNKESMTNTPTTTNTGVNEVLNRLNNLK